jgi:glycosyltransferase involved in cell wall biosynthesis
MSISVLVYSKLFCGDTTTFIYNEVVGISKKCTIQVLCENRSNREKFPFNLVSEIHWDEKFFIRKLKWWLWLKDIYCGFHNTKFSSLLNRKIANFSPDVIHCHFGYEALRVIDNLNKKNILIPLVISFHGYDASQMLRKKSYVKKLKELFENRSDVYAIYVTKHFQKRLLDSGIALNGSNSMLLYYGVNIDQFQRCSRAPRNPFVFLQVSSFAQKKGHKYTVEAFRQFVKANPGVNCRLVFAGDGPLRSVVEAMVDKYGLRKKVIFKGWIAPDEAVALMEEASVFVHHSITAENGDQEGIPNAIIEAMAMELPVLSTYHSGIPELMSNGENGFLVEERDIHTYAQRMGDCLGWSYVPENRVKVEALFEINKHNKQLMSFYKKICKFNQ